MELELPTLSLRTLLSTPSRAATARKIDRFSRPSTSLPTPTAAPATGRASRRAAACAALGVALASLVTLAVPVAAHAAAVSVRSQSKISDTSGGFAGGLDNLDQFGRGLASIGDLDGNGVVDLAVGAYRDDDGGDVAIINTGAVWILFMNADGTVASERKISARSGGFDVTLAPQERFGRSITNLGDLDGDGVVDLAVGADGQGTGRIWILFLNADGSVKGHQLVQDGVGGFTGVLDAGDRFGAASTLLPDMDGDGVPELAVGAEGDDGDGTHRGAVWVLFLGADGTVKAQQKISATEGGFTGVLADGDHFGASVAAVGDLDGDGLDDLAVGAPGDGGGAVWTVLLNANGTVKAARKIAAGMGGFGGTLGPADQLGSALASIDDLDGDGVAELAVGARGDGAGSVWVLFLDRDGTVKAEQKIGMGEGGFGGTLAFGDEFGTSVAAIVGNGGRGVANLVVGAENDDDGGRDRGAVWLLDLRSAYARALKRRR